jgi:hypothetical protein
LQKDLKNWREWAVEKGIKINPTKIKAIRFTRVRFKNPLGYTLCPKNSGSGQL